jgi:hypothetical protein
MSAGAALAANPVARENAHHGTPDWWGKHAPAHTIEGYPTQSSVRPGECLELCVSTRPAARYRVLVYRLGWYGGVGARALAACPAAGDLQGAPREVPKPRPGPQIDAARWPVTDVLPIAPEWSTGVYIARLILTSGEHAGRDAFVPFVVRPRLGQVAAILVQQPVTTAQAYNHWGGKSLYTSNSTEEVAAVKVSFDRPYPAWSVANLNARWPFGCDYQLIRYLEREGFDVGYTTDLDTHREPWSLAGHRLLMTSGHDEYWTREMRDAFEGALAGGANLACMGANTAYWQMRLEDAERTMVEYRWRAEDPELDRALKTEQFRNLDPPRPECLLWGVQYQDGLGLPNQPRDYVLTRECAGHPWLEGTGLRYPATLKGLVGYEWDGLQAGLEPTEATVFFHYENQLANADALVRRDPSGARVFAAGSIQFSWGLDDWGWPEHADERLQRFMRNALDDLVGGASR